MNTSQNSRRVIFRLVFFSLLCSLVYMGMYSKKGFQDWRRIEKQNDQLEARIETIQLKKQNLISKIERLKTDKVIQEQMVREVLGYVHRNEYVIEFE